jgi:hypothetical protein
MYLICLLFTSSEYIHRVWTIIVICTEYKILYATGNGEREQRSSWEKIHLNIIQREKSILTLSTEYSSPYFYISLYNTGPWSDTYVCKEKKKTFLLQKKIYSEHIILPLSLSLSFLLLFFTYLPCGLLSFFMPIGVL